MISRSTRKDMRKVEDCKQLADTLQSLKATGATFAASLTTELSNADVEDLERSKEE